MARTSHVSDSELIGFADREIGGGRAEAIKAHLNLCDACRLQLISLQRAAAVYEEFHREVLKPRLTIPEAEWPQLDLWEKVGARERSLGARPAAWFRGALFASALLACLVLAVVYFQRNSQIGQMRQLLTRAGEVRTSPNRRIELSVAGRSWYRPAVLTGRFSAGGLEHVEALFVKAHYSWEDPLSARSFAAWRSRLREKRDHVTSVPGGGGRRRLYRLRTETADGALRTASLTLRAYDLAAVDGAFDFDDRERVTIEDRGSDAGEVPANSPSPAAKQNSRIPEALEQKVSAADELRVLAALDEIGADVGDPLSLDTDAGKQHVVVTGMGIGKLREKEIRDALVAVPRTVVRFYSAQAAGRGRASASGSPKTYAADVNAPFRHALEERAGGAQQLESITDRALEASNSLLARAHALLVLAQKFPLDVEASFDRGQRETLRKLRHRHAIAIEQTTLELQEALKPLVKDQETNRGDTLGTGIEPDASWQAGAANLYESARALDQSVSKVLGAGFSQQASEGLLNRLPKDVGNVEALARWQAHAK